MGHEQCLEIYVSPGVPSGVLREPHLRFFCLRGLSCHLEAWGVCDEECLDIYVFQSSEFLCEKEGR